MKQESVCPKMTPRDFFLYAGAMITLYWSAGAFVALLFRIIDTVFKDPLDYVDPYSSGIRFTVASLAISFPLSLLLFRTILHDILADGQKIFLSVRRWWFALTIFITTAAMACDLITLLNGFLGGELTTRFFWKVLSVLIVAGLVFGYAWLEIHILSGSTSIARRGFLFNTSFLVLVAIVYGVTIIGSPMSMRAMRLDEKRIQGLASIQWNIVQYWQSKQKLPATLAELTDPISGYKAPIDPRTSQSYEYVPANGTKVPAFKLCAVFERESRAIGFFDFSSLFYPLPQPYYSENWHHGKGRTCFDRTLDPQRYPPAKTE